MEIQIFARDAFRREIISPAAAKYGSEKQPLEDLAKKKHERIFNFYVNLQRKLGGYNSYIFQHTNI